MPTPILDYRTPNRSPPPDEVLLTPMERVGYCAAGIALPVLCFALAANRHPLAPSFQDGSWAAVLRMVPSLRNSWPFAPLFAYAMACMGLMAADPARWAGRTAVLLGLATGAVLGVQYAVITAAGVFLPTGLLTVRYALGLGVMAAVAALTWGVGVAMRHSTNDSFVGAAVSLGLSGLLIAILTGGVAVLIGLVAAPAIMAVAYAGMAWRAVAIHRRLSAEADLYPTPPPARRWAWAEWLLPPAWWVAYAAGWAAALRLAERDYHSLLPPNNASCYVATAASRGHAMLTRRGGPPDGYAANRQVRTLKRFEFFLRAVAPTAHRRLRRWYDRVGPRLAARLTNPWAADVAYAVLKPFEWAAAGALGAARLLPHVILRQSRQPC